MTPPMPTTWRKIISIHPNALRALSNTRAGAGARARARTLNGVVRTVLRQRLAMAASAALGL